MLPVIGKIAHCRQQAAERATAATGLRPSQTVRAFKNLRPLWVLLTEPGLAGRLVKELKYRKILEQKARATKAFLRNYDLLVVPNSQVSGDVTESRLALHIMTCPVFGRYKISNGQLDALVDAWHRTSADGLVSSVAGNIFQRQDLIRWVTKRLHERNVGVSAANLKRPIWLIVVDESYYFCFSRFNYHETGGRDRHTERPGLLPPAIGAAMVFAALPKTGEVVGIRWSEAARCWVRPLNRSRTAFSSAPTSTRKPSDSQPEGCGVTRT
jgi:hypothetical protein